MSESNHPLLNPNTIAKIMAEKDEATRKKAILDEEVKEYSDSINRLFETRDGQFFLKKLIRYTGVFSFDSKIDGAKLVEDAGKRKVFLELILPYLDKKLIAKTLTE